MSSLLPHSLLESGIPLACADTAALPLRPLQLCGLLAAHPEVALQYADTVQQLVLWGSCEDPGQCGVGDPVDAEAAAELASLLAPGDAQLAAAFASSDLAPRVAVLCMLHAWAQQAQRHGEAPHTAGGAAAAQAAALMWRQLLALAGSHPELGAVRYSPLGLVHRKKVRLWQALCVLSPAVPADEAEPGEPRCSSGGAAGSPPAPAAGKGNLPASMHDSPLPFLPPRSL